MPRKTLVKTLKALRLHDVVELGLRVFVLLARLVPQAVLGTQARDAEGVREHARGELARGRREHDHRDPGRARVAPELAEDELIFPSEETLANTFEFMVLDDPDFAPGGAFPGPTVRIPRGTIFHGTTQGKGPPPHTIHWHGLRIPPAMDGTDMVQNPIAPGATFTYRFALPDAGTG